MKISKKIFVLGFVILFIAGCVGAFVFLKPQIKHSLKDQVEAWRLQVKLFPRNAAALDRLATALRQQADYHQAITDFAEILSFDPTWEKVDPAKAKKIKEKINELIGYYKKAIELNPKFVSAYEHLGLLYFDLGQSREAAQYYIQAVNLAPLNLDYHLRLAKLFIDLGDKAQAILAYNQLLKIFPKDENVYVEVIKGLSVELQKHPEDQDLMIARREVVEKFTNFINSKNPNAESYFNLGNVLVQMGDVQRAISAYKMAIELKPNDINVLYNLANIYDLLGQLNEAEELYLKIVKVNANFDLAYSRLGALYFKKDNVMKAKEMYEQAIKINPESALTYFQYGYILEKTGELVKAAQIYQKASDFDHQNAEISYNLGNVYIALKDLNQAQKAYKDTLSVNPNHLNAAVNLCLVDFELKDFKKAAQDCSEAELLGYEVPDKIKKVLDGSLK